MKLHYLNSFELAAFLENLKTLLGGPSLTAIDAAVRAELLAAIGTIPSELNSAASSAEALMNQAQAQVAARDKIKNAALPITRQVRAFLDAGNASKDQYELCGFRYPDKTRTTYVAQMPLALKVTPFTNAVNKGKFKGNNTSGSVMFEVWRREGDDGIWALHMPLKTSRFSDEGVTPGQYYEYKVRARAAKTVSDFTPTAVCYGMN